MKKFKFIHTADIHLGQVLYQNYDRVDEHRHFFLQLTRWCKEEKPDALLVSGDVFDIQQPSASVRKAFTDYFVSLHRECPDMKIIITAGNHDSASRIQADSAVWELANAKIVGSSPAVELLESEDGWQNDFIVRLENGYVIALPYMNGERKELIQSILDFVAAENTEGKPVVMMAHTAVIGLDAEGHEIGSLRCQEVAQMGEGYDYLALGHIHKPQTVGQKSGDDVTYQSPVVRYSGSALHVSCDEKYPHTVSIVEIDGHAGNVRVRQNRIDELRHFYELPLDGSTIKDADEAEAVIRDFCATHERGYIRLRVDYKADLPANFCQTVYDILAATGDEVRFNPKHIWIGAQEDTGTENVKPVFEIADFQQMEDPMTFIEKTSSQYPDLNLDMVREAFDEVRAELIRLSNENNK